MRVLLVLLIIAVFSTAGCVAPESVDKGVGVYTFEKDRVDQKLQGNRGYLQGNAPKTAANKKKTRTIIGIDIELPGAGCDEEKSGTAQPPRQVRSKPSVPANVKTAAKTAMEEQPRGKEVEVKKKDVEEKDYIK